MVNFDEYRLKMHLYIKVMAVASKACIYCRKQNQINCIDINQATLYQMELFKEILQSKL